MSYRDELVADIEGMGQDDAVKRLLSHGLSRGAAMRVWYVALDTRYKSFAAKRGLTQTNDRPAYLEHMTLCRRLGGQLAQEYRCWHSLTGGHLVYTHEPRIAIDDPLLQSTYQPWKSEGCNVIIGNGESIVDPVNRVLVLIYTSIVRVEVPRPSKHWFQKVALEKTRRERRRA